MSIPNQKETKTQLPEKWGIVEPIHRLQQFQAILIRTYVPRWSAWEFENSEVVPDVIGDDDEDLPVHCWYWHSEILAHGGNILEGYTLQKCRTDVPAFHVEAKICSVAHNQLLAESGSCGRMFSQHAFLRVQKSSNA